MIEIRRIDHVALRVADLDEAEARWAIQFGLTEVERVGHHAFLPCGYEPYSLELIGAGAVRLRPLPPPGLGVRRLGRAAGAVRPPRPAWPLAGVGPPAARPGPEPVRLRAPGGGAAAGRVLLRHGAARARPRAARLGG